MPYDGTNYKVKVEPLQRGLAGLKQIGNRLRFPLDHLWDFELGSNSCRSVGCALLTARLTWPRQIAGAWSSAVSDIVGVPERELDSLFGMNDTFGTYGKAHRLVTPHDVADAIDRYIAGKGGAI